MKKYLSTITLVTISFVCLSVPILHFVPEQGILDDIITVDYSSQECIDAANAADSVGGYIACAEKVRKELDFYKNALAIAMLAISISSIFLIFVIHKRGQ